MLGLWGTKPEMKIVYTIFVKNSPIYEGSDIWTMRNVLARRMNAGDLPRLETRFLRAS